MGRTSFAGLKISTISYGLLDFNGYVEETLVASFAENFIGKGIHGNYAKAMLFQIFAYFVTRLVRLS